MQHVDSLSREPIEPAQVPPIVADHKEVFRVELSKIDWISSMQIQYSKTNEQIKIKLFVGNI